MYKEKPDMYLFLITSFQGRRCGFKLSHQQELIQTENGLVILEPSINNNWIS